ncbi:MAG: hypothetical protein HQL58_05255 [Magnetococcales bacterium]|nr:hypothetical protein [Magnetococcales bacterium]
MGKQKRQHSGPKKSKTCYVRRFPVTSLVGMAITDLVRQQKELLSEDEKFYRRLLRCCGSDSDEQETTDLNLGSVLQVAARAESMQKACRQVFDKIAGIHVNCYDAGIFLARCGWLAEAEVALRRAMEINPIDPGICHELAGVLQSQGKEQQAYLAERRAMAISRRMAGRSGRNRPTSRMATSDVRQK